MDIDYSTSLQQLKQITDVWCVCDSAANDGGYVSAADAALRIGARAIAVNAHAVHMIWAWLENKGIEIFVVLGDQEIKGFGPEKLSEQIQSAFKKGADGVILNSFGLLPEITDILLPIRNDLFFGKKLFVTLELKNVKPLDWGDIFRRLKKLGVDGIVLDVRGAKDVAGKIFGMLNNWDSDIKGRVMFLANQPADMEKALRLVEKVKPELARNLRFFVSHKV